MNGHHNNTHRRNTGGVPPRWLRCPRKSNGFVANRFLVFKTPLSNQYDDNVPMEFRFYPQMVVDYVKTTQKKLGLWIDLTNTDRFYPKKQIEDDGICYVKILCRGHGEAPNAEQVKVFVRICEQYIQKHPDDIIGIHCTHGFNRSGYLICALLASVHEWDIHAAITHFAQLRPPGIYKQDYINQLCETYGAPDDGPIPIVPELPEWCFEDEEEQDDDGYATSLNNRPSSSNSRLGKHGMEDEAQNQPRQKRKREMYKANPTFMEGVPGVIPITDRNELAMLQQKVQNMCGWKGTGFPGSQPISMDINNIRLLAEKPYMVSWKADGTRYLMLIDGPRNIYFIDRDNCVFQAPDVTFLRRIKDPNDDPEHLTETLVDGEMVLDKVNDVTIPRYLIYDIIKFRGEEVGKIDFRRRLNCIRDELINPRTVAIERGLIDRSKEPFGIRFKTFWFLNETEKILTGKFAQELLHEPDGVIFQPARDPYKVGRCDEVLKWKPPHLNTIDFRLKIIQQSGEGLLPIKIGELYVGSLDTPFARMKITKAISGLNGKIVECKFEKNQWVFLRERTDKSFPNAFSTAKAITHSITHPVTQEILLDFIANHSYRRP